MLVNACYTILFDFCHVKDLFLKAIPNSSPAIPEQCAHVKDLFLKAIPNDNQNLEQFARHVKDLFLKAIPNQVVVPLCM